MRLVLTTARVNFDFNEMKFDVKEEIPRDFVKGKKLVALFDSIMAAVCYK